MAETSILVVDDSNTILRVVQLVLGKAGYRVLIARDGAEGLRVAHEIRPDLILVDFVMPAMNGYQFCKALADSEALRRVPVILMSAKGNEIGERFVRTMGVVDYITKPFSPDAIKAVVSQALSRRTASAHAARDDGAPDAAGDGFPTMADEGTDPASMFEDDGPTRNDVPLVPPRVDDPILEPGQQDSLTPPPLSSGALARIREALLGAAVAGETDAGLGDRLRDRLDDRLLRRILAADGLARDDETRGAAISGNLAEAPIAEVLALLDHQRQTGVLEIRSGDKVIEICFRGGRIDFAGGAGLGDDLLLGTFLVEREAMSVQDLELFFKSRGSSARLFGEQLVKLNYITDDDLGHALRRQTAERIYEALRWRGGCFTFRKREPAGPAAGKAALGLPVDTVLIEGLRRVDEWHLIEREIDDLTTVFLRNEEALERLPPGHITREEQAILDLVDGRNSVRDIVRKSRTGTFEASQILFRLLSVRLIRRRVQAVAV